MTKCVFPWFLNYYTGSSFYCSCENVNICQMCEHYLYKQKKNMFLFNTDVNP